MLSMKKSNNSLIRFIFSFLIITPLLLFTSKYSWLIYCILPMYGMIVSMIYMYEYEYIHIPDKSWDIPNIFFSDNNDKRPGPEPIDDFIRIAGKNGSGSYPEDFHHKGYSKDDGYTTYSKVPQDWGVNESYDFGDYSDLSKRKESAAQIAAWMEYDAKVNENVRVYLTGEDQTFNSSGKKWYLDYCNDKNVGLIRRENTFAFRQALRNMSK